MLEEDNYTPLSSLGAWLASPHGTLKDGSQSSYAISTKNGIRHKKNTSTRKVLTPEKVPLPLEKALAPKKCWHQKGSGATPWLTEIVVPQTIVSLGIGSSDTQ